MRSTRSVERFKKNQIRHPYASSSAFRDDQQYFAPLATVQTNYAQAMNQHYAYAQGVEAAAQDTAEKARNNRPKNTIKSYESKKK
ncbi:hypothetical protein A0J61_11076, partial [Choanephora cucurbitarum]